MSVDLIVQPSISREFVRAQVSATVAGAAVNPTGGTVKFAYVAIGIEPTDPSWVAGIWESVVPPYIAAILTGPMGTVTPAEGLWDIWIQITFASQLVARKIGRLKIT